MEERKYLVIGSDLSSAWIVHNLCRGGERRIMVVDSALEPGGFYGTSTGAGFKFEKFPQFIDERYIEILGELGIKLRCIERRIDILKQGRYIDKINCWMDADLKPWWIPEGMISGGPLCYPEGGWGPHLRSIFRGPCVEYLPYTPRRIDLYRKIAVLRNGRVVRYRYLIASYPIELVVDAIPPKQVDKGGLSDIYRVRWVNLLNIVLGVRRDPMEWDIGIHGGRASRIHTVVNLSRLDKTYSFKGFTVVSSILSYCKGNPPPPDAVSRVIAELRWAKVIRERSQVAAERIYVIPYIHPVESNETEIWKVVDELRSHNLHPAGVGGLARNLDIGQQIEIATEILNQIYR